MAKTNFTKVEESLKSGIEQLKIKEIVDATDSKRQEKTAEKNLRIERKKIVIRLISDIKNLYKKDDNIYKKLGTTIEKAKILLENPSKLTEEQWQEVLKLQTKVESYKKIFGLKETEVLDDSFIEKEREKQSNARFNIQKKWLPVD